MAKLRRHHPGESLMPARSTPTALRAAALLLLTLLALTPAPAPAADNASSAPPSPDDTTGLYDRPVLVVDPDRHTAPIIRASIDAAGRFAVTGSDDKTVRVWSLADGALLRTIRVPAGPGNVGKIYAVAISPDGALIAAGGWTAEDGKPQVIHLFDRASGASVGRIGESWDVVKHLTFSPDGRRLVATLGKTSGIRLYDRERNWAETARDADYGGDSYGAAFSQDGRLATSSLDGKVRLYDAALRRLAVWDSGSGQRPFGVAFSPDGQRLAVGFDDSTRVALLDGRSLAPLAEPDRGGIDNGDLSKVAWSADGKTLLAGGRYANDAGYPVVAWADGGRGKRRMIAAGQSTLMSLAPLADGGLLAAATDPYLARLSAEGAAVWTQGPPQADFSGQRRTLTLSADGLRVDFGYQQWGKEPARFDLSSLTLSLAPAADGGAIPPNQDALPITDWNYTVSPKLAGTALPLRPFEMSRSLAVQPGARRFVLGTEWSLRAFAADGAPLWRRPAPSVVWAVNISGDGRLAVAAYGDGTIRWHRMEDGRELLAFMPLVNKKDWAAWTPEGFYDATPGARDALRWHVNRGWNAADSLSVSAIPSSHRPDLLLRALRDPDGVTALGRADVAAVQQEVTARTGVNPGAKLHALTIGIKNYGSKASQLRLDYADADARDVARALTGDRGRLYVKGSQQVLSNDDATKPGIFRALQTLRGAMASGNDRDIAVLLFSGHGMLVDGEYYLLPHGVDARDSVGVASSGLSLSELKRQVSLLAAKGRVLLLLDACHSGAAANNAAPDAQQLGSQLKLPQVSVLTSSSANQPSRENADWGHGAFSKALLEALDPDSSVNRNREISILGIATYVRKRVAVLTSSGQSVGMELSFDDDLFDPKL
ncbi:caspase family protein [Azospirillum sp.]|uniref:caspase family protein n=1 Tax=Azospirillum sp. TaxID=34012 RepID=UPI0026304DA8|nr:caspase family protein [Azospirillum sp.]